MSIRMWKRTATHNHAAVEIESALKNAHAALEHQVSLLVVHTNAEYSRGNVYGARSTLDAIGIVRDSQKTLEELQIQWLQRVPGDDPDFDPQDDADAPNYEADAHC